MSKTVFDRNIVIVGNIVIVVNIILTSMVGGSKIKDTVTLNMHAASDLNPKETLANSDDVIGAQRNATMNDAVVEQCVESLRDRQQIRFAVEKTNNALCFTHAIVGRIEFQIAIIACAFEKKKKKRDSKKKKKKPKSARNRAHQLCKKEIAIHRRDDMVDDCQHNYHSRDSILSLQTKKKKKKNRKKVKKCARVVACRNGVEIVPFFNTNTLSCNNGHGASSSSADDSSHPAEPERSKKKKE
jgi:hypothetical protein